MHSKIVQAPPSAHSSRQAACQRPRNLFIPSPSFSDLSYDVTVTLKAHPAFATAFQPPGDTDQTFSWQTNGAEESLIWADSRSPFVSRALWIRKRNRTRLCSRNNTSRLRARYCFENFVKNMKNTYASVSIFYRLNYARENRSSYFLISVCVFVNL